MTNWEDLNQSWEAVTLSWEEIVLVEEVRKVVRGSGGYGYQEYVDGNPWKKINEKLGRDKTKKVIKLYCRVNNMEFDESREMINELKVSINQFERFIQGPINVKILS